MSQWYEYEVCWFRIPWRNPTARESVITSCIYILLYYAYEAAKNWPKSSRFKTFAGIVSTCVSVLSGTFWPIISGFVVLLLKDQPYQDGHPLPSKIDR